MDVAELQQGSIVGAYEIERLLRTGPRARVYRAIQSELRRPVVLHIAKGLPGSREAERFLADARALAGFDHPNLVPVYETGSSQDGLAFAASGATDARPLAELLANGPLQPPTAVAIADDVAGALDSLSGTPFATATPETVLVAESGGRPQAYLAPLESTPDPATGSSVPELGALLESMVGGAAADPELAELIERARNSEYPSAAAVAAAAQAAIGSAAPRRSRRTAVVAGLCVLVGVAAVVALLARGDQKSGPEETTPSARVVSVIDVGGEPASVGFADGALWVGTTSRQLVHIDPRTNRVVGSPIRFSRGQGASNITVRAGGGGVYAMDANERTIVRVDPATGRITRRARFRSTPQALAVDGPRLWIARTNPPGSVPSDELVVLDGRTLKQVGRPTPVGAMPLDVEVRDGVGYTTSVYQGIVTRVAPPSRSTTQVWPATRTGNAAIAGGKLWAPSPIEGILTPLDLHDLHVTGPVARIMRPASAIALGDTLWVVESLGDQNLGVPAVLQKVDPATGELLGHRVPIGRDVGWPAAGAGSIWVPAVSRHAILRVRPVSPGPPPQPSPPAPKHVLRSGPQTPGRWHAVTGGVKFSFSLPGAGWSAAVIKGPSEFIEVHRRDGFLTSLTFAVATQVITAGTDVAPLRSTRQLIDFVRHHPQLVATNRKAVTVGGHPALTVELRTGRARGNVPPFCPAFCVPFLARQGVTFTVDETSAQRLTAVDVDGKVFVVAEGSPPDGSGYPSTRPVVESLRFG